MKHKNLLIGLVIAVYLIGIPIEAAKTSHSMRESFTTDDVRFGGMLAGLIWPIKVPYDYVYNAAGGR